MEHGTGLFFVVSCALRAIMLFFDRTGIPFPTWEMGSRRMSCRRCPLLTRRTAATVRFLGSGGGGVLPDRRGFGGDQSAFGAALITRGNLRSQLLPAFWQGFGCIPAIRQPKGGSVRRSSSGRTSLVALIVARANLAAFAYHRFRAYY